MTTKEITGESDDEISGLTIEVNHNNNLLEEANKKLKPLRDKSVEILSKLQRINLDFKNLEDEEKRAHTDKEKLIKTQKTIEADTEREKNIILDAHSNEKRLNEEKNVLIDTETKYYDLAKKAESDLHTASEDLRKEQDKLEKISRDLSLNNHGKNFVSYLNTINQNLENVKKYIENNDDKNAKIILSDTINSIRSETTRLQSETQLSSTDEISGLTSKIRSSQEKYASSRPRSPAKHTAASGTPPATLPPPARGPHAHPLLAGGVAAAA